MRWVLSAIALLGLYLLATGQGQAANGSNVIFYDSALGTIAGAVVLAALLRPRQSETGACGGWQEPGW